MEYSLTPTSYSGFNTQPVSAFDVIKHVSDAAEAFNDMGFSNWQTQCLLEEVMLYPGSEHNIARESILVIPGIGPKIPRSVVENRIITNNNTKTIVTDAITERDKFAIPLSPLVWVTGIHLMHNRDLRINFLQLAQSRNIQLPEFYSQLAKRVRQSNNGKWLIIPEASDAKLNNLVLSNPSLKDTVYDPAFLRSTSGQLTLLDIFARLADKKGNYIPFVDVSPSNFPDWDAGYTTTITGITVSISSSVMSRNVYVLNGLNYPSNALPRTHIDDANLTGAHYEMVTGVEFSQHWTVSSQFISQATTSSISMYVVKRCCGLILNPHGSKRNREIQKDKSDKHSGNTSRGKTHETIFSSTSVATPSAHELHAPEASDTPVSPRNSSRGSGGRGRTRQNSFNDYYLVVHKSQLHNFGFTLHSNSNGWFAAPSRVRRHDG